MLIARNVQSQVWRYKQDVRQTRSKSSQALAGLALSAGS